MPVNSYTCPYCQHDIVLQGDDVQSSQIDLKFPKDRVKSGLTGLRVVSVVCPNQNCQELVLTVSWHEAKAIQGPYQYKLGAHLEKWKLRPESSEKPQPSYIPPQIVKDYNEACRIRDLSPKASATLSRRCLQSIIRDFWGVNDKRTLKQEIDAIQGKVDTATWEAIDSVRGVGNIGAHMEKDVDLIVSVEPGEAQLLLELIETLFADWYVTKHDRDQRMGALKRLGEEKKATKDKNTSPAAKDS